jgi:hypothetical protein
LSIEKTVLLNHNDCAGPQGMAIGPDNQILLGCNAPSGLTDVPATPTTPATTTNNGSFSTVVIDDEVHITKILNNESGADEVWFNPGDGHYFLARSSANGGQFLGVVDSESLNEDGSVATNAAGKGNVHSVAADPVFNFVYVPIPNTDTDGICASGGGTNGSGCIAVFKAPHDDRCVAEGMPVIRVGERGDPDFFRNRCRR